MPSRNDRFWLAFYIVLVVLLACTDFIGPVNDVMLLIIRFRGLMIAIVCLIAIAHVFTAWTIDDPRTNTKVESLRNKHERKNLKNKE